MAAQGVEINGTVDLTVQVSRDGGDTLIEEVERTIADADGIDLRDFEVEGIEPALNDVGVVGTADIGAAIETESDVEQEVSERLGDIFGISVGDVEVER